MTFFQKNSQWDSDKIRYLPIDRISPAEGQPRTVFDAEALNELAASIQSLGILQPLTVRRTQTGYMLVAGERRLRAAKIAGLERVPCLVIAADGQTASLLTMVENLQRRDLNFLDESRGLFQIITNFHLSQQQLAQRLGRSQPSIANKLRLLNLPHDVLSNLATGGFTERHARALLRLPDADSQRQLTSRIIQENLNVAQTETAVEQLLSPPPPKPRKIFIPKDVRLFLNTVQRSLKLMQSAGVKAQCDRIDDEREMVLTIRIPRQVG